MSETIYRLAADGSLVPLTDAELARRAADAATAQAVSATQLNFLGFLGLFTSIEQAAIVNSTDPRIKLFCLMAAGATTVDLTDPRTVAGTNLLESLGLIAKGRAVQVIAGQAPPTA